MIARDYQAGLEDKHFQKVERTPRHKARERNTKRKEVGEVKFLGTFNPSLISADVLFKKTHSLSTFRSIFKEIFPNKSFLLFTNITKT